LHPKSRRTLSESAQENRKQCELKEGHSKSFYDYIFVHPHLRFGGAEKHSVLLANEMVKQGKTVAFFLHSKSGGLIDQLDSGIHIYGGGQESHFMIPMVAYKLRKFLKTVSSTNIIVRLWSSFMVARLAQQGSSHKFHFYEDLDPLDHAKYISFGNLKQFLVGWILRRSSSVVANTRNTASSMRIVYRLKQVPTVIYPCIDLDLSKRKSPVKKDKPNTLDALTVATVGSLVPRKGHIHVFEALVTLGVNVRWLVIGEGPMSDEIGTWNADYPQVEIQLLGSTPDPATFLHHADVMAHGAESESFGLVIVESLALGLPVVAFDISGPSEIKKVLNVPPNLRLVKPLDTNAMANQIRVLATQSQHRESSGEAQRIERFSARTNFIEWESYIAGK